MNIELIKEEFSIIKVNDISVVDFNKNFLFLGKTDEEISVVCSMNTDISGVIAREDGFVAFRFQGEIDFGKIGILAKISTLLAQNNVGIFAISTYNTDYILVKKHDFSKVLGLLLQNNYEVTNTI